MSFVKKAVKKVFKFVKRLVKNKVFQIVAIIALSVFTAGIAAGGFAAFSGVSSIGGFFTAVGQTMATGLSSITASLGMKGASAALAAKGGAAATAAGLAGAKGVATAASLASAAQSTGVLAPAVTAGTSSMGGAAAAAGVQSATLTAGNVAAATVTKAGLGATVPMAAAGGAAKSGWMSTVKKLAGKKFLGKTVGEYAVNAVAMGIKGSTAEDARKKKYPNGYVAGGTARDGGGYTGTVGIQSDVAPALEPEERIASTQQAEIGEQGDTLASQMAREEHGEETGQAEGLAQYTGPQEQLAQQQPQAGLATPATIEDAGAGQMLMTPQNPEQGLLGENPFADKATRIAYNPRRTGLVGV